jgi:Txe/YoeB family toxin of Txe-Axe toxin-antitoxin module
VADKVVARLLGLMAIVCLNLEHRLVYRVEQNRILFLQARDRYA